MKRKHHAAAAAAAIAIVATGAGAHYVSTHGGKYAFTCDSGLDAFVYHPDRLQGNHTCVLAIGTVADVKPPEADGDYHIELHLDPGQDWMLAPGNYQRQHGNLVLEIICAHQPITQEDAKQPCAGYHNKVSVPKKGDHIVAVGKFIFDAQNSQHAWNELHPITMIAKA